jgi:RNA polymerase sigma-70 factor (ECF subfamily)
VRDPELVQEVFARAFSKNARLAYDGLRPYRPYLLTIARNLVLLQKRSHGERVDIESVELAEEKPSAEEELHRARLKEATAAYVRALSAEEKRFIRWRFEEELSQDDVAARMRTTRRRVRTLEQRVEDGLIEHLKKLGLFDDLT